MRRSFLIGNVWQLGIKCSRKNGDSIDDGGDDFDYEDSGDDIDDDNYDDNNGKSIFITVKYLIDISTIILNTRMIH